MRSGRGGTPPPQRVAPPVEEPVRRFQIDMASQPPWGKWIESMTNRATATPTDGGQGDAKHPPDEPRQPPGPVPNSPAPPCPDAAIPTAARLANTARSAPRKARPGRGRHDQPGEEAARRSPQTPAERETEPQQGRRPPRIRPDPEPTRQQVAGHYRRHGRQRQHPHQRSSRGVTRAGSRSSRMTSGQAGPRSRTLGARMYWAITYWAIGSSARPTRSSCQSSAVRLPGIHRPPAAAAFR